MCCILNTNVTTLFVNIKKIPPWFWPLKSYFPHNSRNTTLQDDEHGDHAIEDRVLNGPMDGDDIIDTNDEDEINRLLQDTFAPLDEDNLHDFMMFLFSRSPNNLFMKAQQPMFYLLYCCWCTWSFWMVYQTLVSHSS